MFSPKCWTDAETDEKWYNIWILLKKISDSELLLLSNESLYCTWYIDHGSGLSFNVVYRMWIYQDLYGVYKMWIYQNIDMRNSDIQILNQFDLFWCTARTGTSKKYGV